MGVAIGVFGVGGLLNLGNGGRGRGLGAGVGWGFGIGPAGAAADARTLAELAPICAACWQPHFQIAFT